jgi:hypothetical protein
LSAAELASFLGSEPTGAICVSDADHRLLALPAGVVRQEGDLLRVRVDGLGAPLKEGTAVCVVADRFRSYEAIRGVILQGSISPAGQTALPAPVVAVAVARTITFSFANVAS